MSDFLTHLAAKAVAQAPAVRPLVRSLFDPPPDGEVPPHAGPLEMHAPPMRSSRAPSFAAETDVADEPPDKDTPPQLLTPVRPAAAVERESPALALGVTDPVRVLEKTGHGQDSPTIGGAGILPAASPASPGILPALRPTEVDPAAAALPSDRVADAMGRGQDARTTAGAGILPAASPASPALPLALRPSEIVPAAAAPASEPMADGIRLKQHARTTAFTGQLPAASPAGPLEPNPPVAPTVTITIGRVEIRAAAPAAQSNAPGPSNTVPPLSLESYLRRSARST